MGIGNGGELRSFVVVAVCACCVGVGVGVSCSALVVWNGIGTEHMVLCCVALGWVEARMGGFAECMAMLCVKVHVYDVCVRMCKYVPDRSRRVDPATEFWRFLGWGDRCG